MIKFSIHPFFFLVFFLALFHGFLYEVLLLFVIVLIHELGHACTARSFGWRVRKVALLPFGGVAEVEEHGNRPLKEEFLMLAAGPLMNVIMIGFGWFALQVGLWQENFAYLFLEYNLIIVLFNLLPIWPLDGGKLLQLAFSLFIPFKKAIRYSLFVSGGCLLVYLLVIILAFPHYFFLWVVAGFLLVAQYIEWKQSPYQFMRFLMERHRRLKEAHPALAEQAVLSLTVFPWQKVQDVTQQMRRHKWHYFCLVDSRGRVVHIFNENDLLDLYFSERMARVPLGDIFT